MSLERLWAGWRSDYVSGMADAAMAEDGCLFCTLYADDDEESMVLERTPLTFSVLNAFPYSSGHLMVAPVRHVSTIERLTADEGAALFAGLARAMAALRAACSPHGFNAGANLGRVAGAGVPGHLHVHVVPRWDGDTNFMATLADTRVIPEDLRTTWKKLRAVWPTPEGPDAA